MILLGLLSATSGEEGILALSRKVWAQTPPVRETSTSRSATPGNPLWSIPLQVLNVTQERPIFSSTRRPPAPVTSAHEPAPAVVVRPKERDHPALSLVGAVIGERDAIAIFFDLARHKTIRMRGGENHEGWVLTIIRPRQVELQSGNQTVVLVLEPATLSPVSTNARTSPIPGTGNYDSSFAPFTPRSTPKNGEPDGL